MWLATLQIQLHSSKFSPRLQRPERSEGATKGPRVSKSRRSRWMKRQHAVTNDTNFFKQTIFERWNLILVTFCPLLCWNTAGVTLKKMSVLSTASFVISMIIHSVHNNNQQSLVGSLLTTMTVKTELQSTYILELSCIHEKGWNVSRCSTHHQCFPTLTIAPLYGAVVVLVRVIALSKFKTTPCA